jgi:hypothetical protein
MRILKDGSMKMKPSALKHVEWMSQDPLPMRSFRKGTNIKAYVGTGWEKGQVVSWSKEGVTVFLPRKNKSVCIRDNRNIREESDK